MFFICDCIVCMFLSLSVWIVLCRKCIFLLLELIRVIVCVGVVIVSMMLGRLGLVFRLVSVVLVMWGRIVSELSR